MDHTDILFFLSVPIMALFFLDRKWNSVIWLIFLFGFGIIIHDKYIECSSIDDQTVSAGEKSQSDDVESSDDADPHYMQRVQSINGVHNDTGAYHMHGF